MTGKNLPATRVDQRKADVTLSLKARCTGLWVISRDWHRTELDLVPAIGKAAYMPKFWDLANGVTGLGGKRERSDYEPPEGPDEVLDKILEKSKQELTGDLVDSNVWILRGFAPWLDGIAGAMTLCKLQNLLRPDGLAYTPLNVAQAIIILSPGAMPPPELSNGEVTVIDWPLPERDEIGKILDNQIEVLPDVKRARVLKSMKGSRDAVIDAAVGLSSREMEDTFARCLTASSAIEATAVAAEKKRLIDQEPAMTYYEPRPGGFAAVGGLDVFKEWAVKTKIAYSPEAREYGLIKPSGALLIGLSGCGKTLSCQALGSEWGWPVIRLDINALKGKYVGQSEASVRRGFAKIDALGQVIVYIDEVEKALEGAVSGSADGGVSADALGAILTWMQDRTSQAFVMMTANDPSKLPPEFMRKGRFDEVWWIDLPTRAERAAIVTATLRTNGRDAEKLGIDLDAVSAATEGFTGAEIAAVIERDAMFAAFADGGREINTSDILAAAQDVIPLMKTSGEKITRMREAWAGRARPATRPDTVQVRARNARMIDIG